jgi:hypothetical protein
MAGLCEFAMIRREITLPDGTKLWLLISQVEHARVSGELARHWQDEFTPDVIDAITHHDDGWATWETEPRLNQEVGAPYSFLEMPLAEALTIWDKSIASARQFGPLAGYIVAGHFYNLLNDSDHAQDGIAVAWLTAQRKVRTAWLDEWFRADRSHTLDGAKRAQHMLQLADLFSLWLCCGCPISGENEIHRDQSLLKLPIDNLFGRFRFVSPVCTNGHTSAGVGIAKLDWKVPVEPYPFRNTPLSLSAMSVAAPVVRYPTWQGFQAVSRPIELRWRFIPAAQQTASAS